MGKRIVNIKINLNNFEVEDGEKYDVNHLKQMVSRYMAVAFDLMSKDVEVEIEELELKN